jgi:DDE superfamily endonuclease
VNVQVLTDAKGCLLWASAALPGAIHDLAATRRHGLITALAKFGVACYADKAYQGAGPMIAVPFRRRPRPLSTNQRIANANRARNRGPGERAMATLKTWKLLTKLRCCPSRATAIVAAIRVLQTIEDHRAGSPTNESAVLPHEGCDFPSVAARRLSSRAATGRQRSTGTPVARRRTETPECPPA